MLMSVLVFSFFFSFFFSFSFFVEEMQREQSPPTPAPLRSRCGGRRGRRARGVGKARCARYGMCTPSHGAHPMCCPVCETRHTGRVAGLARKTVLRICAFPAICSASCGRFFHKHLLHDGRYVRFIVQRQVLRIVVGKAQCSDRCWPARGRGRERGGREKERGEREREEEGGRD